MSATIGAGRGEETSDPVAERHCLGDRVGDEQRGHAASFDQLVQQHAHLGPGDLVERRERLVHHHQRSAEREARTSATRCCMPPDSSCGWASRNAPSPTRCSSSIGSLVVGRWPCG